ncbi:MAG: hypothetical protein ABI836_08120 [Gemmatimonadota bacterium]
MRVHRFGVLLSAVLALGCSADKPAGPEPVVALTKAPTSAGDLQSWTTGHTLPEPLRVLVTRDGVPVGAQGVEWMVDSGQGVFSPAASITGPDGIATSRWTLGIHSGSYQSRVQLAGQTGSAVTFTATAVPNFAFTMEIASGDGQTGPVNTELPEPLIARVGDEFNNAFPGASVEWSVLSGDASVATATTTSDADGLTSATINLGPTPGPIQVRAKLPGNQSALNVVFQVTATP